MKVIISAAAQGIGLAIAKRFASEGAQIFIGDINAEAVERVSGEVAEISGVAADVSDHDQVRNFIAKGVEALGGVDVLINNVGIAGPTGLIEEHDFPGWDEAIKVNLNSHFYCAHEVIPVMKAARSGLIVSISSVAGQFGYPYHGAYAVSKAALIALTQTLAMELGPHNVRANTICPGAVSGPRIEDVIAAEAKSRGVSYDVAYESFISQNSMRTFMEVEDIAALATYLASPAGARISGQTIAVDGNCETLRP